MVNNDELTNLYMTVTLAFNELRNICNILTFMASKFTFLFFFFFFFAKFCAVDDLCLQIIQSRYVIKCLKAVFLFNVFGG